jgi:SAM-dependent methyltransferase
MSGDPAYREVLPLLEGARSVLDVGCGEGYLLALAADHRPGIVLIGVDYDGRRLAQARTALEDVGVTLIEGDARTVDLPEADVVTCLDVLHYHPAADQDALVARLSSAVRPGGTLLLREAVSDEGWRSTATICSERLTIALGRHKGIGVHLRPRAELEGVLKAAGLEVTARSCSQGTPFANWLFTGKKP